MAGGMGRPWSKSTLADRVRPDPSPADRAVPPAELPVSPDAPSPAARPAGVHHCWVDDAPGHAGRYPGLLLEWRRDHDAWAGLVAYVMPEPAGTRVRLVQRWLPAECLRPVDDGTT